MRLLTACHRSSSQQLPGADGHVSVRLRLERRHGDPIGTCRPVGRDPCVQQSLGVRSLLVPYVLGGRKEIAELRRANEILKAASAFFAAELDRPAKR